MQFINDSYFAYQVILTHHQSFSADSCRVAFKSIDPTSHSVLHRLVIILLLYPAWTIKAWRSHLNIIQPYYLPFALPILQILISSHLVLHPRIEHAEFESAGLTTGAVFTIRPIGITPMILFTQCSFSYLYTGVGALKHYTTAFVNWYIIFIYGTLL